MSRDPLETIKNSDPSLYNRITEERKLVYQDGALPAKTKFLIAMALDAAHGAESGVGSLARNAMQHGATKQEVMEALRVAAYISGVGSVYTASIGLTGVIDQNYSGTTAT